MSGHAPFPWQEGLYEELTRGRCPQELDLPTGLGKTSVMHVWLLALAWQAAQQRQEKGTVRLPRRLVWVVDRRVVVDQATDEAEKIAERLESLSDVRGALSDVKAALASLSLSGEPLVVSTLRGELADNRRWSEDPSRPAIIVGTVDMIGSRLLFSGYGVSRRLRARQAALLTKDTLLVNDEAHLTPAFSKLAEQLATRVADGPRGVPPLRFLKVSATQRSGAPAGAFPGSLYQDEAASEIFLKRYRAAKRLELVASDDVRALEKHAKESTGRTIVFVKSPERARKIAGAIRRTHKLDDGEVPLITGEQRGKERDELVGKDEFLRFDGRATTGDCWLVATSAGEVGINITCDHLITELDTADHLLQRFGRLNRFGNTDGVATVVYSPKRLKSPKVIEAQRQTLEYLESLECDVSPMALRLNPPPPECLSPEPRCGPLLPWHVDVWSMTSLTEKDWPSRPSVQPWLRGDDEEGSPPETYVVWREDMGDLVRRQVSDRDREEVFHCYRILAKERLKQGTDRLCTALEKSPYGDVRALLIGRDRQIEVADLKSLISPPRRSALNYATLVLPPGVGALDANGMVDWSRGVLEGEEGRDRYDVSGVDGQRHKQRAVEKPDDVDNEWRLRYRVRLLDDDDAEEGLSWFYYTKKPAEQRGSSQLLEAHNQSVADIASDLGRRLLGVESPLVKVQQWAAQRHDLGKGRPIWQLYARTPEGADPRAKSDAYGSPSLLDGYRHELGSLLDALKDASGDLTEDERDLAFHLIASHHGWARPHFPERAFDRQGVRDSREAASEVARRFGRLQRKHGAWGLAYLEALFCAADAWASREAVEGDLNA